LIHPIDTTNHIAMHQIVGSGQNMEVYLFNDF